MDTKKSASSPAGSSMENDGLIDLSPSLILDLAEHGTSMERLLAREVLNLMDEVKMNMEQKPKGWGINRPISKATLDKAWDDLAQIRDRFDRAEHLITLLSKKLYALHASAARLIVDREEFVHITDDCEICALLIAIEDFKKEIRNG